jgi:hypothetical protein
MAAHGNTLSNARDVQFGRFGGDEVEKYEIANRPGASQDVDLAGMRHHRFEGKTYSACKAVFALRIRDTLSLRDAFVVRAFECSAMTSGLI